MNEKVDNQVIGTSDMPPAKTENYETFYRVTQIFLNDLKTVLQDAAYADVKQFLDYLKTYNYILPVALLNEFLNKLSAMPFRMVSPIMSVIENKDLFPKYFEDVTSQIKANQQANTPNQQIKPTNTK